MSTLHMFVGIPGSNRKEMASEFAKENQIQLFSSDEIRKELGNVKNNLIFEEIVRRIKKVILKGESVVFDATNLYSKQRKTMISQIRAKNNVCHYVSDNLEQCFERDSKNLESVGEAIVVQKFLTAEIPFQSEGWDDVFYHVNPMTKDEFQNYLKENKINMIEHEEMSIELASFFMESGKPILDSRPDGELKKIGYNNASAQIAFGWMYPHFNLSFIEEVVTLILYKKRMMSVTGKGLETIKNQVGEDLYNKLIILNEF